MIQLFPELVPEKSRFETGRELSDAASAVARGGASRKREGRADHRRADAGRLQFGYFRARVPGRPDGRATGGRPGSARCGQPCRAPPRATNRSTCSTAASTYLSRSADLPSGFGAPASPGLIDVYRAGKHHHRQCAGTVSRRQGDLFYMPEIVEFYTGRKAILGNIPTWRCSEPDSLKYVLEHIAELVIKGRCTAPAAACWSGQRLRRRSEAFATKLRGKTTQLSPSRRWHCRADLTEEGAGAAPCRPAPYDASDASDRARGTSAWR